MKPLAITLSACLLLLCGFAAETQAQENPKGTLKETVSELENQREKAKEIEAENKKVSREIDELQKQSRTLVSAIRSKQEAVAAARERIGTLQREQQAKRALLDDQKEHIERLLSGMIRLRRLPAHYVSAQPLEMHQLVQSAGAIDVTFKAAQNAFSAINAEYAALQGLSLELEKQEKQLATELSSVELEQNRLTDLISKRRSLQQNLQRDQAKVARRVKELSDKSGDLQELIARLEAETTLFQSVGVPSSKPDAPSKTTAAPASTLTARKGALAYPAAGKILHRFGDKREGDERYQGVEIAASARAPVTAPHGGRIVFSGDFMDYGPMVIIEHDKTYHSVIAGLDVVAVELGQTITGGDLVGTMGASGGKQTLYYELRKHSKAIDPAAWMGNVKLATRN